MKNQIVSNFDNKISRAVPGHIQKRTTCFSQDTTSQVEVRRYSLEKEINVYFYNDKEENSCQKKEFSNASSQSKTNYFSGNNYYNECEINNPIWNVAKHYMDAPRFLKLLLVPLLVPLVYLCWLAQFPTLCIGGTLLTLTGTVLKAFDAEISFSSPFIVLNKTWGDLPASDIWLLYLIVGGGILYCFFAGLYCVFTPKIYLRKTEGTPQDK